MIRIMIFLIACLTALDAQIRVVSTENIPIPRSEVWSNAVFSPSGNEIYLTNAQYNGIWQFSLTTKLLKEITRDVHSGYNFVISDDGTKIAYRRTAVEGEYTTRIQESVDLDMRTMRKTVVERGNSLATPVYIYDRNSQSSKILLDRTNPFPEQSAIQLLGIEETKIAILKNGAKSIIDPFDKGQYIWPALSPDKTKLVAVEMDHGAFVSDIEGKNIVPLGKCNAPQWTRDGKWIIGMDDKDDGHNIVSSEIVAISVDGKTRIVLTNTPSMVEMFPVVSPIANRIVASTAAGELLLLTYEEVQ